MRLIKKIRQFVSDSYIKLFKTQHITIWNGTDSEGNAAWLLKSKGSPPILRRWSATKQFKTFSDVMEAALRIQQKKDNVDSESHIV